MIEVHAEFPQREVIQANAVVDNEEKTVSEVIISAKPEITGVTASVDNETGTPYVDITETGTGIDFSFDLAFHNLKGDKGDKGETGQTGNGIVSITKTATVGLEDDYTINFTNGTQTVYTVTNGADGQDGRDGTDGQDGFSPIATVEPIQDGAKITITDKDGITTTNVYNGTDGTDGADGQAATVTVGTTTTGAAGTNASVVNSGTSSAAVFDFVIPRGDKGDKGDKGDTGSQGPQGVQGEQGPQGIQGPQGETGATGQDGFSPSANVSQSGGVTTISITDKNGTTTESIDLSNYATQTDLTNGLATKQDTLIAGTDLEIINAVTPLLPTGYTELEYIEGTGTQYIDTGYYGTQNSGAYVRFAITDQTSSGSPRIFGTRNGTGGTGAFAFISSFNGTTSTNDYFFVAANGTSSPGNAYPINTEWNEVSSNVENDKKSYFNNNLLFTGNSTAFTSNAQASIFRTYNRTSYGLPATAKISIVRIYENAILVHNYIPCRRDSDDELGMYDLVSNTFLGNSGTGTFTGGPEVIYPTTTTINFTNASGYIKGITSSDVTTALGYTPYDSSNPAGFTSNVGTVTSVNNTQPDANGDVTLTIPTVNDGVLTITQNGTSKGTFSANQSINDTIALTDTTYNNFTGADGTNAGSSGLVPAPSATDNDKYLKGDGTWASVSASSGANTDLSNLTATGEAHFLKNTATGTNSLTIGGTATSVDAAVNIGYNSSVALSAGGQATRGIAIGVGANVTGTDSIQLGMGTASSNSSLYAGFYIYGNYQLLDGTTGLIPDARLSTNIARTSQIPSTSGLANTSLSNLSSTGQKVIDGQWVYKFLSGSSATAVGTVTIDLSSYLPSDSYKYEVLINLCLYSNPSSGGTDVFLWSDVFQNTNTGQDERVARCNANSRASENRFTMPVGTGRWIKRQIVDKAATVSCNVSFWGYRRIGTNT